jgi:hypothetical protein
MSEPTGEEIQGVVLDADEEAEHEAQVAELADLDARGLLRPAADMFAELRAELSQRQAG